MDLDAIWDDAWGWSSDGFGDRRRERGSFGHPIVTNAASLHSCVEVCELIELSFGVVSVVGPVIGVLDWVDMLQGEVRFSPHLFEWHIVKQKCVRLVCEKLTLSGDIVRFKIEMGFTRNLQNVTVILTSWLHCRRL